MKEPAPRVALAHKVSYEEFLAWADEDTLAEWVDGEIEMYSPASRRHQELVDFLVQVMGIFVQARSLGLVLTAPFQMRLERSGREPDLLFIGSERVHLLRETYLDGPADLAVEVISGESRRRDTETKLAEYEAGGVKEYWLIDPVERRADFYVLDVDGRYHSRPADAGGVYRSAAIDGFWVEVGWLWQEPLPQVLGILRELELV